MRVGIALIPSVLLFGAACTNQVPFGTGTDGGSGSATGSTGGSGSEGDSGSVGDSGNVDDTGEVDPTTTEVAVDVNRDIDILFVVDNSGSMGLAQANLVASIGSFAQALDESNYRIAVTTTDMGNYWCTGSTPEAGSFVATSCRARLGEFTFGDVDATSLCTDVCDLETLGVAQPWIENIAGVTNLPEGVSPTQALQCMLPQGINGCGFESPLESMRSALLRSDSADEPQFGFIRPHAALAVVFVTDEADCSFNRDLQNIVFGEEGVGNQVFWSLPDQQVAPTSAVCWNAGVDCDFSLELDQCVAVDKGVDGNPVDAASAEEDAALYPVERYRALLQQLEDAKKQLDPNQEIIVAGIVGVPENYPSIQLIPYAPGPGPDDPSSFQVQFGIGQGCVSQVTEAVPPVRMHSFSDAFLVDEDEVNLFSVCSNDYFPALGTIVDAIRDQLRPACVPICVADTDAVAEGLQPSCTMSQTYTAPDGTPHEDVLPHCPDGVVPDGAEACFVMLTGTEMDVLCRDEGWNLEFSIVRAPGSPAPSGASILATCDPSGNRAVDCPDLPE